MEANRKRKRSRGSRW